MPVTGTIDHRGRNSIVYSHPTS